VTVVWAAPATVHTAHTEQHTSHSKDAVLARNHIAVVGDAPLLPPAAPGGGGGHFTAPAADQPADFNAFNSLKDNGKPPTLQERLASESPLLSSMHEALCHTRMVPPRTFTHIRPSHGLQAAAADLAPVSA